MMSEEKFLVHLSNRELQRRGQKMQNNASFLMLSKKGWWTTAGAAPAGDRSPPRPPSSLSGSLLQTRQVVEDGH